MNYQGKQVAITGYDGFIGSRLVDRLQNELGAQVIALVGDVRDPGTFLGLNHGIDYLFHFADPSSQVLFKRQPMYAAEVTIKGFINAAKACREHGVRLIYPSTGLLSGGDTNEYARCKQLSEDMHLGENLDALALRIFATYGPGEGHKSNYASVPYLFARDMVDGKSPVVFGDGNQVRDFIYINDVVESILHMADEAPNGVFDVGSGVPTSFNQIIKVINEQLFPGELDRYIEPRYMDQPKGYVLETAADPSRAAEYWQPKHSFEDGITELVHSMKGGAA